MSYRGSFGSGLTGSGVWFPVGHIIANLVFVDFLNFLILPVFPKIFGRGMFWMINIMIPSIKKNPGGSTSRNRSFFKAWETKI